MMRLSRFAILLAAMATTLPGSDCLIVRGDKVFAADLAPAIPAFATVEPSILIGYAPNPGTERSFTAGQLTRLLNRHTTEAEAAVASDGICIERAAEQLDAARIEEAIRTALPYPDASVIVVDFSKHSVPEGELRFRMSGLQRPLQATPEAAVLWRGVVEYGDRRTTRVWARVRLGVKQHQVVATRAVTSGAEFTAEDVTVEVVRSFPGAAQTLDNLSLVVGARSRRSIRAGEPILASAIMPAQDVARGEIVSVEVRSGAARLRFEGEAEAAGQRGKRIYVKNPESGRRFLATVTGKGTVLVLPMSRAGSL